MDRLIKHNHVEYRVEKVNFPYNDQIISYHVSETLPDGRYYKCSEFLTDNGVNQFLIQRSKCHGSLIPSSKLI